MLKIVPSLIFSLLLCVATTGCGSSDSASVPEAGSPPPAGASDINADQLAAIERARLASEPDKKNGSAVE